VERLKEHILMVIIREMMMGRVVSVGRIDCHWWCRKHFSQSYISISEGSPLDSRIMKGILKTLWKPNELIM